MNTLIAGAIYTMIALGFNLIYGVTKFFHVAHGGFIVIGGYAVFYLYTTHGLDLYLSIPAAIIFGGFMGMAADKLLFHQLRKRKGTSMIMFVASLGILWAIQAAIGLAFDTEFHRLTGFNVLPEMYKISNAVITDVQVVVIIIGFTIMTTLILVINKTKFGKAVKAISDDEEVAKVMGINTERIMGYVFFIGSAIAAVGGILIGFDVGLTPTMGMSLLLKGIIASIVGGIGNIYGCVLGAYLLGFLENTGVLLISGGWQDAIAFGILIFFLLFRPQGLLNK